MNDIYLVGVDGKNKREAMTQGSWTRSIPAC